MNPAALRVVLDSNTWLDLLWFRDPRCAALAGALEQGRLAAVTSAECRDEWTRVIAYPQLQIDDDACARLRSGFDAHARLVDMPPLAAALPRCRDPDDQKFLEIALCAGAAALFTRDAELLRLSRRLQRAGMFAVLQPWEASLLLGRQDDGAA